MAPFTPSQATVAPGATVASRSTSVSPQTTRSSSTKTLSSGLGKEVTSMVLWLSHPSASMPMTSYSPGALTVMLESPVVAQTAERLGPKGRAVKSRS